MATVTTSTFSGNEAGGDGGAIDNGDGGNGGNGNGALVVTSTFAPPSTKEGGPAPAAVATLARSNSRACLRAEQDRRATVLVPVVRPSRLGYQLLHSHLDKVLTRPLRTCDHVVAPQAGWAAFMDLDHEQTT